MGICNLKIKKNSKRTEIQGEQKQQEDGSNIQGNPLLNNLSKPFSEIKPENSNQIEISASHISKSQPRLNSFDGKSENNPIFSNINDNNDNKESRIHPTLENSQSNNNNINYEFCLKDKKIILPSQMRENYDFRQFKLLGLGAFGCVFQLKEARSENFHAIKRMEFKDSDDLFNITKEINILYRLLPYGNIVTFKQNYSDMVNSAMYIAMEKGDFSLEEYINQSENGSLSTSILHQIMIDITFALVYSYRESVVHSDIKPGNIIVFVNSQKRSELFNIHNGQPSEENLIFKLNDFGSGTLKISKNDLKLKDHMSYTVLYAAPEVKQAEAKEEEEEELKEKEEKEEDKKESQTQKQKYLNYEKADVFSFGMTLLNCCGIGKDVLAKLNQVEKEDAFEKEINRIMDSLAKKLKYRSELLNVIQGMIKYKKEERFSLQDICSNMKFEVPEAKYPEKKREIRQVHEAIEENEAILPPSNIAQPIEYDFEPIFELIEKKLKEVNQRPFYDHKILERIHNRYKKMSPQKHTPVRMVVKYLDSNEIYYGGFEEGLRHLSGLLIFPDGSIYQGKFRRDAASGKGKKIFSNGNVFDGYFLNGLIEGGILFYSDGRKYIGMFKNDLPNGEGAEILVDGTIFEGIFENGLKNGTGLLKISDEIFEVEYEKGELKRRLRKWEGELKSVVVVK